MDLQQTPAPGDRLVRFTGDAIEFALRSGDGRPWPSHWRALLRTNLGRAEAGRTEILAAVETRKPPTRASWHDIPLRQSDDQWVARLALTEVGYFRAKTYALDERGWQHWPSGPDVGITVQPNTARTANILYCAFPRMFGPSKAAVSTSAPDGDALLRRLDAQGYTVIPPSGKLRDVARALPHIFDTLGCRILHLLPVTPTPTTYARFGRFGSPYACGDLLAIDPALVEFDRRTTGVDQFRELALAVHRRGGRLFLDMVINHTGWGSPLQELHPEWFRREPDGQFASPGAWGTTWEDLVELEHHHAKLRQSLGRVFLEWCRRGVDGFRCDAGYKVPLPVWQYVTARVRQEFPNTVFLLEGLGGSWETSESLLTEGGLQWAYSELFQNCDPTQISVYLDHALRQSARVGLLVHYSETHDNERLAGRGRAWSLLRNRLCALASASGAFGYTCGVEWLAPERVNVHSSCGLAWGNPGNIIEDLARLARLLSDHPCFFDGARTTRLSNPASPVYALLRLAATGDDSVIVLVNTDPVQRQTLRLHFASLQAAGWPTPDPTPPPGAAWFELLGQPLPSMAADSTGLSFTLPPAAAFCLASSPRPRGPGGDAYRQDKACASLALAVLAHSVPPEVLGDVDAQATGKALETDPTGFLSAATYLNPAIPAAEILPRLRDASAQYPRVVTWRLANLRRITLVPPAHWLLVVDDTMFRATLASSGEPHPRHAESVATAHGHIACFAPARLPADAELRLERYADQNPSVCAPIRFLGAEPAPLDPAAIDAASAMVLLTNGRGAMARMAVDLGAIHSKYDGLLCANLDPSVPVDRHVFVKRARVWISADGFLSPLDATNLLGFHPGPPAEWRFLAHAGDDRTVPITLRIRMLPDRNTTQLRFHRPTSHEPGAPECGRPRPQHEPGAPAIRDVRLTVRLDIEDRNFHAETRRNPGADHHFSTHCRPITSTRGTSQDGLSGETMPGSSIGFEFTPAADRQLRAWSSAGTYHPQPEWCENVPHPWEASRGHIESGDAFSPGWFELPLHEDRPVLVTVSAELDAPAGSEPVGQTTDSPTASLPPDPLPVPDVLHLATRAFVVRRGQGYTVIAGYPWFLNWGRDTLIAARGLIAAGLLHKVRHILRVFGQFEQQGTLPNTIHGQDASNRETSDAPLWYGIACEELAAATALERRVTPDRPAPHDAVCGTQDPYAMEVDEQGRTVRDVIASIGRHHLQGTPTGVRVDPASALVWSPSHFTWMDTNHPACTPREGYPVCIQALWIRLLRQLARLAIPAVGEPWADLAHRALASLEQRFWLEDLGYYADVLVARPGQTAAQATQDTSLRSNMLLVPALGLSTPHHARRCIEVARADLLVPGALRSLAPRPVSPPFPIHGNQGQLLNNPHEPYWGRYEGDEDTRRKPAYHNGTAWTWTLPSFCEGLARAWNFAPEAVAAARAYLGSIDVLLRDGCVGHLPEIVDGDAPHTQRGCDAQAWSVTEALRVERCLRTPHRMASGEDPSRLSSPIPIDRLA